MIVNDYTAITTDLTWAKTQGRTVVTYAFNSAPRDYWFTAPGLPVDTLGETFESAARAASTVRAAFDRWESVASIQFVEVGGEAAFINLGLFDFDRDPISDEFAGYAYYPSFFPSDNNIGGDIFIDDEWANDQGIWLHEIGHAIGLAHPHEGARILVESLDNTSQTVMSYNGRLVDLGPLDVQAIQAMYGADITPNLIVSDHELRFVGRDDLYLQLRDYDGNDLGAAFDWRLIGEADVQLDGDFEYIAVNDTLGRWATLGPGQDGMIDFSDHGFGGDTRVVGYYLDPLVEAGVIEKGGRFDSAKRLELDLKVGNLKHVGAFDVDGDGYQNLYFKASDGTAYLNALMHADGNIQYANYQSEAQMIAYLESSGWSSAAFDPWLTI